jgi:hypothetical protein
LFYDEQFSFYFKNLFLQNNIYLISSEEFQFSETEKEKRAYLKKLIKKRIKKKN